MWVSGKIFVICQGRRLWSRQSLFYRPLALYPLHGSQPCHGEGACVAQWSMSHAMQGHQDGWVIVERVLKGKDKDITLPIKVYIVKAMVFPVVIYGSESWTIKKAEYPRIDALELWCWRRLLIFPWTTRRSNQSMLKEISREYSLEGLMLKLQYFGLLVQRADSLEKTLMLGKIEGRRGRGW